MEVKKAYLGDLMFNLNIWRRDLKSQKKQMKKFQRKLEQISSRKFELKAKQGIEQFQNKIIIEKDVIDKLLHKINIKKDEIKNADTTLEIDGTLRKRQFPLQKEMRTYVKLHYELKEAMMDFFLKWL